MAEHLRADGWQWVDEEVCVVLDLHTGLQKFGAKASYVGSEAEALRYVGRSGGHRMVILRLPAIVAHRLDEQQRGEGNTRIDIHRKCACGEPLPARRLRCFRCAPIGEDGVRSE